MGRTHRRRKHRKPRIFHTCNNEKNLVLLNSWLSKESVRFSKKLVLAIFDDTGRGVLTKKKIKAGEELMNLPLNLTINVTSLLMDHMFCDLFLKNKVACLSEYKKLVTFQSLMAFYLVYLKVQGTGSKWNIYIENLPKTYSVPYFLPNNIKKNIDRDILTVIKKQKTIIERSYNIFEEILFNSLSINTLVNNLKTRFCMSEYEWAYFTVNTRCVYMDLSNLIDFSNDSDTILALVSDNTKISLCPCLDMINHNPNTRNETKLIVNKDLNLMPILNITEETFSDVSFSIYTKNNFDPYTQVFICYGDSHNVKLITEFGFFLPSNDMDCVLFDYTTVSTFISSNKVQLSADQTSFIISHGLDKDLYIDFRGLSFNFCGLLMVVMYYYKKDIDLSKLIYSAAVCSNDSLLLSFIKPLAKQKLIEIRNNINKLEVFRKCIILDNCIQLMCQYIRILEKFIEM